MLNKEFEAFFKRFKLERECVRNRGKHFCPFGSPTNAGCKKCWRDYIEQQEPPAVNQPELFGGSDA